MQTKSLLNLWTDLELRQQQQRLPFGAQQVKKQTLNESLLQLLANQHNVHVFGSTPPTTASSLLNQLPVPLMLQMNNWQARSDGQLISSVVATPNNQVNRSGGQSDRRNVVGSPRLNRRQLANLNLVDRWPSHSPAPDILVRLVGYWHAKCALQYLLCYLLSSSVTILVCLRLFRFCSWRGSPNDPRDGVYSSKQATATDLASYGFYYRTRLGEFQQHHHYIRFLKLKAKRLTRELI